MDRIRTRILDNTKITEYYSHGQWYIYDTKRHVNNSYLGYYIAVIGLVLLLIAVSWESSYVVGKLLELLC